MSINYKDSNIYIKNKMNDIQYNIITNKELEIIYSKITSLIDEYFNKLILLHKKIIINYLYKLIVIFNTYYYNDNFIKQLYQNNYQDIFSLLVLLMPFYDLNKSKEIFTLDELFFNQNDKAKKLESSYYIDHLYLEMYKNTDPNYLKKYFNSSLICIWNTLSQMHCLILPNWCNIFPYTMESYKTSDLYKNFEYLYLEKKMFNSYNLLHQLIDTDKHTDYDFETEKNFKLGFPILYGTVYSFLYLDIKNIKWMIYDLSIGNEKIIPNIIYLGNILQLNNIVDKSWNKNDVSEKENLIKLWNNFIESPDTNQIGLKSLVLFYLRWEKDNNKLNSLKIPKKCKEFITTNLNNVHEENFSNDNINDDDIEFQLYGTNELDKCLKKIYKNIKFENIYNYIYECIHRFRYTWYGYCCLDDSKKILTVDNFFEKYFVNNSVNINGIESSSAAKYLYYLTPKNIYNFCKSLIHFKNDDKYQSLSQEPKWNNMTFLMQQLFIDRLMNTEQIETWFNINNNLKKTYSNLNQNKIIKMMNKLIQIFYNTNLFVNIIFQTLVYNGMLSYYKYNPKMTDGNIIPNKNINKDEWESYIFKNIDIKSYSKSYHAFSNTILEALPSNTIQTIINSKWYTNFGASWIAQIQVYHHYNSNRVMFITGATGAGKSTVTPFLLVYAVKILNFNNNARVVCTQPRTQPTKDNSEQISKNIGLPIIIKQNNDIDNLNDLYKNTKIGEGIKQDINYIQYKHKNGTVTDDIYHPYLRLYTDGSLYNIIKQNYIFKKSIVGSNSDKADYLSTNIFDVILVDEAHEHNTYMDMILTLSKYATYINNQVTLGIISATMDNDELIYRRYFHPIDDNWKYPLDVYTYDIVMDDKNNINNINNINNEKYLPDKNLIDRRIHLSIPFGGMNFEVKEYPNNSSPYPIVVDTFINMQIINTKVIEIVKHILNTTSKGDILIFQPGEADIKKLLVEINKQTPPNVLAIPFYSKLDNEILENIVKKIAKVEVRNSKLRYPKNKYNITDIFHIPQNELLPEGTYNRFIIIATNIAEASITIDTLEFVIDTGNQKISIFDSDTNQDNLKIIPIAIPNQKQRKGRSGRTKPGFAYYTYDRTKLGEKVVYKMNIENINSFILGLITSSDTKLIDSNSDPYKIDDINLIPEFLLKQNTYFELNKKSLKFELKLFDYKTDINKKKSNRAEDIIYPFYDGGYKLETLEDNDGKFFIVHPGEDYFIRNPKTLEILSFESNYFNKVTKAFNYGKALGMISDSNLLSPYGLLVNSIVDFIEISDNPIDFTRILLDCFSFGIDINSDIFKNILMFIVFRTTITNIRVSNILVGKADYLIYSSLIDNSFYEEINFKNDILHYLDPELKNLQELITIRINNFVDHKLCGKIINNPIGISSKLSSNIEEIKKILITYFTIKFKVEIIIHNSLYIQKKYFDELITELIEQNSNINDSNEYLSFINKFILYYNESYDYIKINVINKLIQDFKNKISEINTSNKLSNDIINKIIKIIKNSSLFENEFLKKIKLSDNKSYSIDIFSRFNILSNYDKICFLIIKNFPQNILIKVPDTEFYVDYYKKDINKIYGIEKIMFKLNEKKTISFTSTKVPIDLRNFYIFAVGMNDEYDLKNIMVLSELIINFLNSYFKSIGVNLFSKNLLFNEEICKEIFPNKYQNIMKKIDKIIKYIRDTNYS